MAAKVPNLLSALADVRPGAKGVLQAFLIPPWNSFFQRFTQAAPAIQTITLTGSPFSYLANEAGNIIVTGGTISNISLTRGSTTINLTGQRVIPISVSDIFSITYSVAPTLQFVGA